MRDRRKGAGARAVRATPSRRAAMVLGAFLAVARAAGADSGSVCGTGHGEGLTLTIFLSPTPLRVGSAEVAALVQDAGGVPLSGARVALAMGSPGGPEGHPVSLRAGADANRLLYASSIVLGAQGPLALRVEASHQGHEVSAGCTVAVAGAPPLLLDRWPLLVLPPVAVALYAANGILAARQRARRAGRPTPDRPGS